GRKRIPPSRRRVAPRELRGQEHPDDDGDRHRDAHDGEQLGASRQSLDVNSAAAGRRGRHVVCRRTARTASVTKKIALTARTTAPPVGTRNFVDTPSPPAPAKNATAMLHRR